MPIKNRTSALKDSRKRVLKDLQGLAQTKCERCEHWYHNEDIAQDISIKHEVTMCHECAKDSCGTCSVCGDRTLLDRLVNRLFALVCGDCDYNDGESNTGDDEEYYKIAEGMQYD